MLGKSLLITVAKSETQAGRSETVRVRSVVVEVVEVVRPPAARATSHVHFGIGHQIHTACITRKV